MLHGGQLPSSTATQGPHCPRFFQVTLPLPLLPVPSSCPLQLIIYPEFSFMQRVPKHTYLSLFDFTLIKFSWPFAFCAGCFSCNMMHFHNMHFSSSECSRPVIIYFTGQARPSGCSTFVSGAIVLGTLYFVCCYAQQAPQG